MSTQKKKESCSKCICNKQSIFTDLDEANIEIIDQHRVINRYKKGQAIFLQDNPSFGIFCLTSGKIKLVKISNTGNESIVRLIGPGNVLGFNSALSGDVHYSSAIAIEDCTACFFEKKTILQLIANTSPLALALIKSLSASLKLADLSTASKSQQNVREKLATTFLALMKTNGVSDNDSCKLDIKLTREEFASIIGSTTETICRLITEFKTEGLIVEQDKILYVINEKKLKTFAGN